MRRSVRSFVLILAVVGLLTAGCSTYFDSDPQRSAGPGKVTPTVPAPATPAVPAPEQKAPTTPTTPEVPVVSGDSQALQAALAEPTLLAYRIMLADTPRGTDKDAYLDMLLEQKGSPGKDEIWLLIFPNDNHDIRFVMGSLLFEKKISVQQMLEMIRDEYFPKARSGDPAYGLANLIRRVNQVVQ